MNANANDLFRLHIIVTGRVQNVGFRAFVQEAATRLGLTGWVRNVGYNQVEAMAEGPRPALEKFAEAVKTGPRGSRVDEANEEWGTATGEFASFYVRSSR
ncbi:MAG: acylphosphatase [Chloroflexi bacterium]|nr:acylphosphatase [Chloroflexota bacterium]